MIRFETKTWLMENQVKLSCFRKCWSGDILIKISPDLTLKQQLNTMTLTELLLDKTLGAVHHAEDWVGKSWYSSFIWLYCVSCIRTDNYDSAGCYKDSVFMHLVSRLNVPSRRDRRAPSLKIMVCLGVIFYFEVSERCTHRNASWRRGNKMLPATLSPDLKHRHVRVKHRAICAPEVCFIACFDDVQLLLISWWFSLL